MYLQVHSGLIQCIHGIVTLPFFFSNYLELFFLEHYFVLKPLFVKE